jgi:predicted PolB exonuclease-like 3'-5' exonuclease
MSQLILDIETFSLDAAAQFIEEPSAPANYKDPEKIAAYVAEAKQKAISRCALDADLCRVVAIGASNQHGQHVFLAQDERQEGLALEAIADFVNGATQIVGFNILSFDLPVLIRRAQYLGVEFPGISLDKYRTPHLDLMDFLSFNGKIKERSLSFYCKRFGIDVADTSSGKDIDALVRAGDWQAVEAHCRADVEKTRKLAARLNLLHAVHAPEAEVVL